MNYTIVGSGPAGLSLAYVLALNNYNIEIIEQSDQLGGSWNSQWIDNKYFSENSPRVYSDSGNSKKLLSHLGFTEKDFQTIYGNLFQTNYKIATLIFKHFNLLDYFIFLFGMIKFTFVFKNITVYDWMSKTYFSTRGKKAIKIICILICDRPDKTNINDFFGSVGGSSGGVLPKQMKEPNKWHELIENYLKTKNNVKIFKNTRVEKLYKNDDVFSIFTKNVKYGNHDIKTANKVFLCTQSNGIYPILNNSNGDIKNNWMPIDKMKLWSNNTYYSGFGFQLHFDKDVLFKNEWCWSCMGDWTVIVLPVSNWLKKISKDKSIKTVWSCCIVDMDTKSKRINKTANQCTHKEVIQECLFQIRKSYDIPLPKVITTSLGLTKINNKWLSKNTGYTKNTYNDINMKGKVDNLFALGCFTKTKKNHIAYMIGAIDAAAQYLNSYEKLDINIFN